MANLLNVLNGPWIVKNDPPTYQLKEAMANADMFPDNIELDGKIHRFKIDGSKDAGWYVAFDGDFPAGIFGNWKTGEQQKWHADVGRELTTVEKMQQSRKIEELRAIRDRELKKKQETAADIVTKIWGTAGLASDDHPYLKRKGVKAHGLRITGDGRLISPMYNSKGELSSLQYISNNGDKQFHTGGAVKGAFHIIGELKDDLCIAEGYATGATIHEVTGLTVAITYSAGNLLSVAEIFREKNLTIFADNDESGVGQSYAEQAAAKCGARVIIPPQLGDANDYVQSGGDLLSLFNTKQEDWLISVNEFCRNPEPIKWLVKHWLPEKSMIMVHGQSGSGKTFVVLDWCLRIASGMDDWFGEKVKPASVVYLAGEGHNGLKGRIAAWMQEHNPNKVNMFLSKSGTDLNTPEGLLKTVKEIRKLQDQPKLIVVDTLHRFLDGDENSAQDTKTMLDACAELTREFNASVILVHHTGVSAEAQHRARGSSAWKGALDIEISVEKLEKDPHIELVQRKNKDAELAPNKALELTSVNIIGWLDEDGEQVSSAIIQEGTEKKELPNKTVLRDQAIYQKAWEQGGELLRGKPFVSYSLLKDTLMKELEITDAAAKKQLKSSGNGFTSRLSEAKYIKRVDEPCNGFLMISELHLPSYILLNNRLGYSGVH